MVASKKKKRVNTRFSMGGATQSRLDCTFAKFFHSCSKFFSALEIKDNSKFNIHHCMSSKYWVHRYVHMGSVVILETEEKENEMIIERVS